MLNQHVHSFWHKKRGLFFSFGVQDLLGYFYVHLRNIPYEVISSPRGDGGLCESLNL